MDAVYDNGAVDMVPPDVHPCMECSARDWDPEFCRGCPDFDMCPGLQPEAESEPGYRAFLQWFMGT
ncbi:unnamed protein product [marine sediment metagenome]|uniref:Uncharacterized protein n=1 Tax=marine sediment metagenome TaxID=412755 RepID=X1ELK5_9ZZZZ